MNYFGIFSKIYETVAQEKCLDCQAFIKRGSKILDFGCGSGIMAKKFQDFFKAEIIGVDIEDNRVSPIPFKKIDGKSLPFPDDSFDIVLISYVLHHAKEPVTLLKEAKRVGKKIIIYEDLPEGIISELRCLLHQTTFNFFFPEQTKKFNFKNEKEWEKIFKELKLKTIAKKRISNKFDLIDPVFKIFFVLEKV